MDVGEGDMRIALLSANLGGFERPVPVWWS